mmetsp:Transcript_9323/g.20060  ORF Transcript_9323/g.20060 Transcript_9323/m.20060 type:complete len:89 (-) Transcript_9323:30-296(-)
MGLFSFSVSEMQPKAPRPQSSPTELSHQFPSRLEEGAPPRSGRNEGLGHHAPMPMPLMAVHQGGTRRPVRTEGTSASTGSQGEREVLD